MPSEIDDNRLLIELTADIVSAYVGNNAVPVSSLPELIENVNSSLTKVRQPAGRVAALGSCGQSEKVRVPRLHHLPRGREKVQIVEAPYRRPLRCHAGGISGEVGLGA